MLKRRIMLVDDHPLFRSGLRRILDQDPRLKVVAEATSGHEALHQADIHRPALVLMDVQLPGVTGLQIASALRRQRPNTAIIFLSMHVDDERLFAAIRAGAAGFLTKDADPTIDPRRGPLRAARREPAPAGRADQSQPGAPRPRRVPLPQRAQGRGRPGRTSPSRRASWKSSTAW